MSENTNSDDLLEKARARWAEAEKKEAEEEAKKQAQDAERLRQDYLRRTGRTEIKP